MPKFKFETKRDFDYVMEALRAAYAELEALEADLPWFTSESTELIENAVTILEGASDASKD